MIIGITGTDGAGKGSAVSYLVQQKAFTHISSRSLIEQEVAKRGLQPDRATLRLVANDMRREAGNDVLVQRAFERVSEFDITHAVIESIRTVAEAETLKAWGGILLAIDADPQVRYERISRRGSDTDHVTFEEFLALEAVEMNDPDPNGMQKAKVMEMADYTISNNASYEDLYQQLHVFCDEYHV